MATIPKTIIMLLSLKEKELIKFKDYLGSPYFNTNGNLPRFFCTIINEVKNKDFVFDEKEFLKKCGGLNKNTFKKYLGLLKQHFENFIVLQAIEKDKNYSNVYLLRDYLIRKGGIFFENKFNNSIKEWGHSIKNIDSYSFKYEFEVLYDSYKKHYKDNRAGDTNLRNTNTAIDKEFITKKLCNLILMLNRQNITKTEYNFSLKNCVENYFENDNSEKDPLINLLYQAYMVLTGTNKKTALENLKLQLRDENLKISRDLIFNLSMIVHNNLKNLISNKKELDQEIFEIHEILLERKYALANGKLPAYFYKNFSSNCLELEKYNYADTFIEKFKNKLLPNEAPKNIYNYCKARLYTYMCKPNNARELIFKINNFDDKLLKFDLRCLEIMIHYDLKEYHLLETNIHNFHTALTPKRIKSISPDNTLVYKNFLKCIEKMYQFNINPNSTKNDVSLVKSFLNESNKFSNHKWLLMRLNDLLQKF